ncbi:MAG: O-antigen polymerase [Ramlibacter sp.]|jgi:O-antigen ligase|nr:O-antigen polymerase [Ramlibacter sp.]
MAVAYGLQPPAWPNAAVLLGLAAVSAWAILSAGLSPDSVALAGACLLIFVAAGMAAGAVQHRGFVKLIALAWLLAAVISTAMALVQYFGATERLFPWVNASATGEAYANLRQRNQFASLTAIGMASLFCLSRPGSARWPAMAAMVWLAVGNAATTSRTGLLELMLLGVLALAWPTPRRERVMLWLAGLAAYVVAAVTMPWLLEIATGEPGNRLWERVASVEGCSSRTVLWSNVMYLIAQKPWIGWGWGNLDYAHYVTLYEGPRFCDILDNAHSLPLHLAVELGVPAALFTFAALLWAIARARPWATPDPARQMAWAVLTVIGVHSLLEYPLWYGPFQIAFGLCLGLLWPAADRHASPRASLPLSRARVASVAVAACVAAACAYAAWDYRRVSQIYLPPEARSPAMRDDPLPEIRRSWLFRNQARFAELTITPLTQANAAWTFDSARALLHYSPEPRVIEKLIESATVLGREEEMLLDLARFRAAFPEAYAKWSKARAGGAAPVGQPAT